MSKSTALTLFSVLLINAFLARAQGGYTGSGTVTQGIATTIASNIFPGCTGARVTNIGSITATDSTVWTVPAAVNFQTAPRLPDLYNQCSGVIPAGLSSVNLSNVPVTVIDNTGDTVTAYLLGDNYFEFYVNGILVGVDPVPYTPFNSCIVRFKVSRPYTVAVKLVDWEENLGVGTELNAGNPYHAGDGGFIAVFSDSAITDATWKAQTFYIAPVENLSNIIELQDGTRSSSTASTAPACSTSCYAIHYPEPSNWQAPSFDDSGWPSAVTYTPAVVGVNWPAYTNFSTLWTRSQFIWSSNLILDNIVLARKTIGIPTDVPEIKPPQPLKSAGIENGNIVLSHDALPDGFTLDLLDQSGRLIAHWTPESGSTAGILTLPIPADLSAGTFVLVLKSEHVQQSIKIVNTKK